MSWLSKLAPKSGVIKGAVAPDCLTCIGASPLVACHSHRSTVASHLPSDVFKGCRPCRYDVTISTPHLLMTKPLSSNRRPPTGVLTEDEALSTPFDYDDIPNWRPESSIDLIIFTSFSNLKFGVSSWSLTESYFALKCFVMNLSDGSCTNFEGRMSVWMANRLKETLHLGEVIDSFM